MLAHHNHEMKELQDILYAMKLTYTERERDAAHSFESLMDELKNKVYRTRLSAQIWYNNMV